MGWVEGQSWCREKHEDGTMGRWEYKSLKEEMHAVSFYGVWLIL